MEFKENASSWERPRTTRRYLHPPMAERIVTLWAEGKLVMGEVLRNADYTGYHKLTVNGLWLVHGEDDAPFDHLQAENTMEEDGIPIHGLRHHEGALEVELEAFCDTGRRPTAYIRLRMTNRGSSSVQEKMAFLVRYGREEELIYGSPDEYVHYAPDISVWKNAPVTFHEREKTAGMALAVYDDHAFVTCDGEFPLSWDAEAGAVRWEAALAPGETRSLWFSLGSGELLPFFYDEEKAHTRTFWKSQLAKIDSIPENLMKETEKLSILKSLTVQMLQCFCLPVGLDYPLARQGGLQRLIWPWEAIPMLEALGEIGEFGDYIEPVISAYFDVMQVPSGEIIPFGFGWANVTASALTSFARYCLRRSRRFWYKHRDQAMTAFDWLRRTRASTVPSDGVYAGLFPPKRGNDWEEVFQVWGSTDTANIDGLGAFAKAAEVFGDPRASEVRAEYQDYLSAMRRCYQKILDEDAGKPTLRVPLCPSGEDEELVRSCYPRNHAGKFLRLGIIDLIHADRVEAQMEKEGQCHEGLHGHMPYPDGNTHIWYLSIPEYEWCLARIMQGRIADAEKILESQLRWAMTAEHYMIERYADNDPYYTPWSPNASASGRTVLMLLQLFRAKQR